MMTRSKSNEESWKARVQGMRLRNEVFTELYEDLDITETRLVPTRLSVTFGLMGNGFSGVLVQTGTAKRVTDKILVAVKCIKVDRLHHTVLHRFIKEFNGTHERQHTNLVNYWHSFLHKSGVLVVMDHVSWKSAPLRKVIDIVWNVGVLALGEALPLT
jgi:hypothetical protein